MLGKGYFIGKTGSSEGAGSHEDIRVNDDNQVVLNPLDPIFVSDDGQVYFDTSRKNAYMYMRNNEVYVEKVM